MSNFNTSYVVIKLTGSYRFTSTKEISIHLMLLLNEIYVGVAQAKVLFQYILCCY